MDRSGREKKKKNNKNTHTTPNWTMSNNNNNTSRKLDDLERRFGCKLNGKQFKILQFFFVANFHNTMKKIVSTNKKCQKNVV